MSTRKMRTVVGSLARIAAVALLVAVIVQPAVAAVFTVKLTNGSEIDTRYRPVESPADETKIQFITEHGNWITLPKNLVESIRSDFESRGFGTILDTNTVVLGYSINDLPVPAEGGASAGDALLDFLRGPQADPFTASQFGEPVVVGGNPTGGVPIGFTGQTTPPLGRRSSGEPPIAGDNQ